MVEDHPLYGRGRLSAPIPNLSHRENQGTTTTNYELIEELRSIRKQGEIDLLAIENYDPDFSVKLSACALESESETLLGHWLDRRLSVLKKTQQDLRTAWLKTQVDVSAGED